VELSNSHWQGADRFDAAYLDLAQALIAEGRVGCVRDLLLVAGRHRGLWASPAGTSLLADVIVLLLEGLADGHVAEVVPAFAICPPDLARTGMDMFTAAYFPNGAEVDPHRLGDAALLCLALLTGAIGRHDEAIAMIDEALASRYSEDFTQAALTVVDHLRKVAA
jgi:hypothetical protein